LHRIITRAVSAVCFCLAVSSAQEGLWSVGSRVEGTVDFEPGNDFLLGPEIGYSNFNLGGHRLQLKGAYLTTRLEQFFRPNIIKQDYFLFSPVWHFRRNAFFDPNIQMDLGYMRYDVENERIFGSLDNDSYIAAIQAGFSVNLAEGEYGIFYHVGYNLITPDSGLVFPGVFGFGFWVML
jgi:hypothetical protein